MTSQMISTSPHAKQEQTFVFIKPDGVQRTLVGDIITRFEKTGLKLVAIKMFVPDIKRLTVHYGKSDTWCTEKGQKTVDGIIARGQTPTKPTIEYGRDIVRALLKYMSASPAIAMVWEGNEAVAVIRKHTGGTEPATSPVGTIRGDLTLDSYNIANMDGRAVRNLIHCTEKPEEAQGEIDIWFKPEEVISYKHINEAILYDIDLNGILE